MDEYTNEYRQAFEELQERDTFKGQQWFGERQRLVDEYSWAVPNRDVLLYLAEFDELIEIGAGNGYWAKCIEEWGGSVEAYDIDVPDETYHEVHERDIVTGFRNSGGVYNKPVLMVWPPCDDEMATAVLDQEPSHILYVGEERGGCTATDSFFDGLHKQYGLAAKIDIPSYTGISDNFFHYIRKV